MGGLKCNKQTLHELIILIFRSLSLFHGRNSLPLVLKGKCYIQSKFLYPNMKKHEKTKLSLTLFSFSFCCYCVCTGLVLSFHACLLCILKIYSGYSISRPENGFCYMYIYAQENYSRKNYCKINLSSILITFKIIQ